MRRHALIVIALLAAGLSLAGCDKGRRTPLNPTGPAGCLGCHGGANDQTGAPPNDLQGTTTGGAVGAHTAHLGKQVACEECHKVPARIADPGHISRPDGKADGDGRAEITWGGRATLGGTFSAGYTPVPSTEASPGRGGTCAVYCHGVTLGAGGSNTTPKWSDPPMDCGSCHGTSTVGAPPTHSAGLTPTTCAACHPDTVTPDGQITTTGTHINGIVEVKGCTGCHGDDTRGESGSSASWAPPKDSLGATTGAKVGAHLRHVSTVASLGSRLSKRFDCSECHRMPTNGGPHGQPVIQWATGTNNLVNRGSLTPTYASGTCASTYCHGATLPGGSSKNPSWSAAAAPAACGTCHFLANPPAPHPARDRDGLAITAATQCWKCHPGTVDTTGAINVINGLHVNGQLDIDYHPANYSNPTDHGPDALSPPASLAACKTCHGPDLGGQGAAPSCTACHAIPTLTSPQGHPNWLSECTFCHGQGNRAGDSAFPLVPSVIPAGANASLQVRANVAAPPVGTQPNELTASSPAVGAHQAHLAPSTSLNPAGPLSIQIQCTECHGAVLPTNADHANGSVAIGWGPLAKARTAVPTPAEGNLVAGWEANPTCTNYCHGITLAGGGNKTNPNWIAGAPEAACGTCHAARPGLWHPNNGDCGSCHPGYTATAVNPATHVNGLIDPAGTNCTSCHGGASGNMAPPRDTSGGTAGVKVGAHQAHVNAASNVAPLVAAGYSCSVCHVMPGTLRHANGQVDLLWTSPATAGGVVPTPLSGALAVATWESTSPTCTNYCHGASLTAAGGTNNSPVWTGDVTQVACGTCHAAPPPLSAATGANHPKNPVCANCHGAGYATTGVTGTARNTHVNGTLNLVVTGCTQCHGDRAASGVTLTVGLVSAAPGGGNLLTSADTTGQSLATAPGVGAHLAHLAGTTYRAAALTCIDCHALPPSNTDVSHATGVGMSGNVISGARASMAFGNLARGVGASFNNELTAPIYSGSSSAAYGATAGSCNSVYCHGQFKNGKTNNAVSWTATGLNCNSCHGRGTGLTATPPGGNHINSTLCGNCHTGYSDTTVVKATHIDGQVQAAGVSCTACHGDPTRVAVPTASDVDLGGNVLIRAAPPVDLARVATGNKVGAHLAHVNQGATGTPLSSAQHCLACHVVPTHLGTGTATITWGDIANQGGGASYNAGSQTCSSTYCHGQFPGGIPTNVIPWGTGSTAGTKLGCTSCHGDPPAHPHPQNLACATCHAGYSTTAVVVATHVDGVVTKSTSGCTACHGELSAAGVTVVPQVNLTAAAPGATGTNTVDTTGQTAATSAGVGAHKAHLGAGVIAHVAIACSECHPVPASNSDTSHASGAIGTGGARATVAFGNISTRSVNAWSGAPVVPTYLGSTTSAGGTGGGSCASTYCHGNFTNGRGNAGVAWATPGPMTCNSCHGAGTGATATLPGGSHPQGNTSCGMCHGGSYSTTAADPALHLNGKLDVAAQTCSGCHGDVTRTPALTATDLDGQVPSQPLVRAAPPVGVTASNQIGAHLAHVNQAASGAPLSSAQHCAACHVVPTTPFHASGVTTVTWGGLATNFGLVSPLTYDALGHSCSSTYCHGQFTGGIQGNVVNWGTGSSPATKLGCTSCHATPPAHPHPSNTTCGACHAGATATTLTAAAVITHVDGLVTKTTGGCTSCHGELPLAGVTLTNPLAAAPGATGTNTVDSAGLSGAATSAGTGAHKAHLVNTNYRAVLACGECHLLPPSNTDTTHAVGGGTNGARATLTWGNLALGVGATFNNELVAPAYTGSTTGTLANVAGSCASTYCHGQFKNGRKATVAWTAAPGLTCNSCHGAGLATVTTATLPGGSHPQVSTDCSKCHSGYSGTTVNPATHLNGTLEYLPLTCSSCHGDVTRVPVASATWTDVNLQNLVRAAPPVDTNGISGGNVVGPHQAHVNQGNLPAFSNAFRCENCHNGLVWATAPHTIPPSPVVWGNIAIDGGAATPLGYNTATKTCSNTYCHGNFSYGKGANPIGWLSTSTPTTKLACNACHGQASAAAPQPVHPHPQNTACGDCHAGATTTTLTAAAAATHVDGLTTKTTSGCTACHGDLSVAGVTLTTNLAAAAPGQTGGLKSEDTTGQTLTSAAGVGVHQAHLTGGPTRNALLCTECHALPASNTDVSHGNSGTGTGGARATLTFGTLATRSTNTWSGGPVTPTYGTSTTGTGGTTGGSCASTYCHGNFTNGLNASPVWTAANTITCNSCHGRTAGAVASPPGGTHPNNALCGNCHTGYTSSGVNLATHMNGQLDVIPQTCTSCHGTAGRTVVVSATDLDALGANLALSAPPVDSLSAASGNVVGAHLAHVNQGDLPALSSALRCVNCHSGLVPTVAPHAPAANPVAFGNLATARAAAPVTYSSATKTCSNTYCHGQFTYGKLGTTIPWGTGTNGKLTCFACHGSSAAAPQPAHPHPQNTACGDCHAGYTVSTVAAATHVDGLTTKTTSGCTACHGDLSVAGVTLTTNLAAAAPGQTGGLKSEDTTGQTLTSAAGVGVHQAHLTGGPTRNALLCTECHALPASNTDVSHGNSGTGTGGARATLTFGTLATRSTNTWSGGPVTPTYGTSTTGTGGTTGGSCASTYCHGNFTNGLNASPVWTAANTITCNSCHGRTAGAVASPPGGTHPNNALCGNCHTGYTSSGVNLATHMNGQLDVIPQTCTSCHGTAGRTVVASATDLDGLGARLALSAPPVDSTGTASGNVVGAHLAHVNQGTAPAFSSALRCVNCHSGLVPTVAPHAPATNPVAFGNLATARAAAPVTYSSATKTCSSTYCHGNFSYGLGANPVGWGTGTPGKLACNGCHGQSAAAPQPAHPHPQNTTCGSCHAGATTTTLTAAAAATHVDGLTTKTTSGCTACHGELSLAGVVRANPLGAAPGATGTNTVDTTGLSATTAPGVGAHKAHLTGTTFRTAALACTECHALPPSDTDVSHGNSGTGTGGARATIAWGNLAGDAAFGARTPAYSGSTTGAGGVVGGSCASTYCHSPRADTVAGLNQTPSWVAAGTVLCGDCHGLPPVAAAHPVNALCSQCHPGYPDSPVAATALSAAAKLIHINGQLDGGESTGATPCLNCHKTDAATGAKYADMVSSTATYHHVVAEGTVFKTYPTTATGQACLQCHADHDVFNPALNVANTLGRGANLRTTIATAPTKVASVSGNYTNTDFSGTAGLCLSCHAAAGGLVKSTTAQKTYAGAGNTITHVIDGTAYSTSAHQYAVAGSITTGPSAFSANCMKCHSDAPVGTTYPEKQNGTYEFALHTSVDRRLRNPMGQTTPVDDHAEDHCFRCHSTTADPLPGAGPAKAAANRDYFNSVAMSASSQDIFQAFTNTLHVSKHNVGGYDFIHQPTEAPGGAGGTKHVECEDCHEPHGTKAGVKPASNNNLVWGPITGVTGVVPTWSAVNFTAPTAYATSSAAATEYQICFKCHSGANAGLATWGAGDWTDLALEFSPANKSRHPVASALSAAGSGTTMLAATQLVAPWAPGNTMTCSDCHGTDAASPAAQGPHGSAVKYMLKGANRAWPYTVAGATTGTLFKISTSETGLGTANGLFCRNCHPQMNSTGSNAIHRHADLVAGRHGANATVPSCTGCHLRVPHGGKVSRLIVTTNAPARYKIGTVNIAGFTKTTKDAYTVTANIKSACSTHSGAPAGEAW
jgi:predicted CxxxxCH...CXXCH cytochrome family protein